jgi:adenylate cyclase
LLRGEGKLKDGLDASPAIAGGAWWSTRFRRWAGLRIASCVALAAGVAGLLLSVDLLGGGIEDRLGQFVLFHLRGALPPPIEAVVVAEDRASAEALGLPAGTQRWPRSLHARAIEKLTAHGAAVVALDLMFNTPDPVEDDALALALREAGCVVLLQGVERRIISGQAGSSIEIDQPTDPIPKLGGAATAIARFPLPKVPARVDRFWTFHGVAGAPTVPSVVLQLAARDIASRWNDLLATEPDLPKFATKDWTDANVTAAMQRLHAALRADPNAADRLRARLRTDTANGGDNSRLSALVDLYAGEDSRYLDLRGPAGTVRTFSYARLFSEPAESADTALGDLSGKVVFIGVSELHSVAQTDSYDTVFSGDDGINVTGAEIGATAVADLAEEASPRRLGSVAAIEITVVALALGAAASAGRIVLVLGAGAAIAAAVLAVGWYAFLTEHWLLPVADPILFQIPAAALTAAWCLRGEERRQRQHMAGAARQFLPEEVVRNLASGPLRESGSLAGDVRYSVCLASDIEDFTTLSERLPAHTVQTLINQYFHGMFEIMQRHGGVISDIHGDGVMCVWGGPVYLPSACHDAVSAALEFLEFVEQFNLRHPDERLPTRIGIHAGSAFIGLVGGAGRYASTIVGDVANTASRVEGLNKQLGTRLLASEEVLRELAGFVMRPLGEFLLAGKSEPIRVAEVLGRAGDLCAVVLAGNFAEALKLFQSRRWSDAVTLLEALLRANPCDGPSLYFRSRALRLRAAPEEAAAGLVPRMDKE